MPRGIPNGKKTANSEEEQQKARLRKELAAIPNKDERIQDVVEMLRKEREITANERINIIVEYACLGKEPKTEKYFGRPRYIKGSRHGRTRLAKRSARRDDIPPPEQKMFVYDHEVARVLYGDKYESLRRPGTEYPMKKEEPLEEDEHVKEHSRDSGCPVSPTDKQIDKKEECSPRGSVEKESRKRRSPDLLPEEANAASGTSHFIVKGNTPLTVIHKLLERKRPIHHDLKLELIDTSGKEILTDNEMKLTVADVANKQGWTRNSPLRILYTIIRFNESEELPVLDVQARCDESEEQQLSSVEEAHLQQLRHSQHMQQLQAQMYQQHVQRMQQPYAVMVAEDGTHITMAQYMMAQQQQLHHHQQQQQQQHLQQDMENTSRMQAPPPHRISPPHHQQWMAPPPFLGGGEGVMTPPPPSQLQQQVTSSIFPPGHVIIGHGNGNTHVVPANVSVESAISNPASVKKRQRMAPRRMKERDEMMARNGIEKGTTPFIDGKGRKMMNQPVNLPYGIVSIRMPNGCTPAMMSSDANLPIEAITYDGRSLPTTLNELSSMSQLVTSRPSSSLPPPSQLTPDDRVDEAISSVCSKVAAMDRRASTASSASATEADAVKPPLPAAEPPAEEEAPPPLTPPPCLDAPDSPRSLEIDEMMEDEPPQVAPQMIPA